MREPPSDPCAGCSGALKGLPPAQQNSRVNAIQLFCSLLPAEQSGMFYLERARNPIMPHFLCTEQVLFNGAVLIVLEIGTYLGRGGVCAR